MAEPCEGRETHHAGCECHEARRDAEVEALLADVERCLGIIAEVERQRDDARADHAAAEECLAGIVAAWERADDDGRRMADTFVSGLRREIEEARDGKL